MRYISDRWRNLTAGTLLVAGLLVACSQPTGKGDNTSQSPRQTTQGDLQIAKIVSYAPVEVYPGAVTARLFVQGGRDADGRAVFVESQGRRLTPVQRRAIEATIKIGHYGPGHLVAAACFVPHHFIRYYDAAGDQIGELAICFCCAGIRASPGLEDLAAADPDRSELTFDYPVLKAVIEGMDYRTDFECA